VPVLRGDGAVFGRWARWVSARPARCAVAGIALLLALGAPALSMRLGFPDDGAQPVGSPARRAYDLIAAHFGAGTSGPIAIVVEGSAAEATLAATHAAADPEVASVAPPVASPDGRVHLVIVLPRHAPQDPAVAAMVHRLRASSLAGPARVSVGGVVATTIDIADMIEAKVPRVVLAVLAATFVLLLIVFRSLVVPIKAVLLNLLSVGAAYGVLVAVFQWGIGRALVGLDHAIPIVSLLPLLLFAILFGLSMDYEVFLLARVREEHDRGASTEDSVARALASTGRVVSSAALIMVCVFVAFALGPDPMVKMFGVGLAAAVLIDATVVRLVLVPALMVLMGEANWWLPRALGRRLPHVSLEETARE
jgi:putative drug exporter of the RND superfamily